MKARKSRLLIVDASVVCSAGETAFRTSSSCRACLEAILHICHRVAVTGPILDEWNRHMSRFSRKWRRFMAGKKKPIKTIAPAAVSLDIEAFSGPAREQIEKDLILLAAALAADRIIVTRDDRLKAALMTHGDGAAVLNAIRWVNPVADGPKALHDL